MLLLCLLPIFLVPCEGFSQQRQNDIYALFDVTFVHPSVAFSVNQNYTLRPSLNNFNPQEDANLYINLIKDKKILPKNAIFNVSNPEQLEESKKLYNLFMACPDYDQFYASAQWIKKHINQGLYLFTVCQALVNHPETRLYMIPPIYELNPFYFFDYRAILEAQRSNGTVVEGRFSDEVMSYFAEDVGWNAYYYYFNLYYPSWRDHNHKKDCFYFFHQQLMARYQLERMANGLGLVSSVDWYQPIEVPYKPNLVHPNGEMLPNRLEALVVDNHTLNNLEVLTDNIVYSIVSNHIHKNNEKLEIIDDPHTYKSNGIGLLTELFIKSSSNNIEDSLETTGRRLLGLDHFETSLRDPAFYGFYKKLLDLFQMHQVNKEPYTKYDLECDVNLTSANFGKLETYFEPWNADVTRVCYSTENASCTGSRVFIQQNRLNHKPFTYKIHIDAKQSRPIYFKVFLGPLLGKNRTLHKGINNFVLLDYFKHQGDYGEHVVTRSSDDNAIYAPEITNNIQKEDGFGMRQYLKLPRRLMLPKGTPNGTKFQLIIFAWQTNYDDYNFGKAPNTPDLFWGDYPLGSETLGHPLDRHISDTDYFRNLQNVLFKVVKIYHQE